MRVISVAKVVMPSSMHWNDLYATLRQDHPGIAFPSLAIRLGWGKVKLCHADCRGIQRRYFQGGLLHAILFLRGLSLRQKEPIVVHNHTPVLMFALFAARLLGARFRIVTTQHNNWASFRAHQKFFLWLSALLSDVYVTCGKSVAETVPAALFNRVKQRGEFLAIPNGVPSEQLEEYAQVRFGEMSGRATDHETSTMIVAKMAPQKNCMHLLELISAIPELGHVVWFGDGQMRADLIAERARLGLGQRVRFEGVVPRARVYEALTEHDFYLTASLWEGLSVADLEAVAIGCLPLMSEIPQRREIAEETNVRLLPPGDLNVWRSAVQRYASMTHLQRAEVGLDLSRRACAAFSMDRMVTRYMNAYRQAAQVRPSVSNTT